MNMKHVNLTALALAMLMLLSCLLILGTAAQPSDYSTVSNSGTRDEWCTSLDGTGAAAYYTCSYAYNKLTAMAPSTLKANLKALMTSTHKRITSYND